METTRICSPVRLRSQTTCQDFSNSPIRTMTNRQNLTRLNVMATVDDILGDRLLDMLHGLISRSSVAHAILAVRSGDGSFQWAGAVGEARPGGPPMRPDTPYFIASIDKLLTTTAILKLHERGSINLAEPISVYLPKDLIGGIHRLEGIDHSDSITVKHLLSHTSGLADWLEDRPRAGLSLIDRLARNGDMSLSLEEILRNVRDHLSPHFPPQSGELKRQKVRYCDTNFILLIAIIEATTGRPLHKVHEEFLFKPLNMHHTWLAGRSEPIAPTPEPAMLWYDTMPLNIPLLMRSSWAVYSTVDDTLKLLHALIQDKVFAKPEMFDLMQKRWNRFGIPLDRAAARSPSWPIEYGLGVMRFHDPILRLLGRLPRYLRPIYPAPAVVGHTGSTGSWLFFCPQLNVLFSGTVNQATAGALPFRLISKVLKIIDGLRQI